MTENEKAGPKIEVSQELIADFKSGLPNLLREFPPNQCNNI